MNSIEAALICKALSDSNRLQIMDLLKNGEMCACKLLEHFDISQPTLSHHMRILTEANLIIMRKEGKWSHYQINSVTLDHFSAFIRVLNQVEEGSNCTCMK